MAITLEAFRNKLDSKLWSSASPLYRTVTVYNLSTSNQDTYDDEYLVYDSGTSAKAIPYNHYFYTKEQLKWGELQTGQKDVVFRYDSPIVNTSKITDSIETKDYIVTNIEKFDYGDGAVAIVARLQETL